MLSRWPHERERSDLTITIQRSSPSPIHAIEDLVAVSLTHLGRLGILSASNALNDLENIPLGTTRPYAWHNFYTTRQASKFMMILLKVHC